MQIKKPFITFTGKEYDERNHFCPLLHRLKELGLELLYDFDGVWWLRDQPYYDIREVRTVLKVGDYDEN